jgi:PmbA protein
VRDDPLVPRALGSRAYDGEGLATRPRDVFEKGVLRNWYVDTYYGRKLDLPPTTAHPTNLSWALGSRSSDQLVADAGEAVLVTGFLGGNCNGTTGDFSLGVFGFAVRGGRVAEPLSEMNVSGNHLELWPNLVAVGNDPNPNSPLGTPTFVFEGVQIAGT